LSKIDLKDFNQNLVLTLVVAILGCDIGWDGMPKACPAAFLAF